MDGNQAAHLLALLEERLPSKRERIATQLAAGMLANIAASDWDWFRQTGSIYVAVGIADDLIAALEGDEQ